MQAPIVTGERATEWVAVLMTPTEKAAYANRASSLGISLGQFFREAGAAYAKSTMDDHASDAALEAALTQLELSTRRAGQALDETLADIRAALDQER